jgi:hypothetical protein
MASIEWEGLSHAQLAEALAAGLEERDRRVQELMALTGDPLGQQEERRRPGRPLGSGSKAKDEPRLSARAQQLAEAAGDREVVQ